MEVFMAICIGTGQAAPGDVWTNGKIGAGHSSPAYPIDSLGRCFIRGSGGGGGGFWASDSKSSGTIFSFIGRGNDTENHVGFYSNGNWRMVIKDSGLSGFGTTNPQATVHINAVLRLEPQAVPPAGGKGDLYVNSNGELNVHNGAGWKKVMTA
jgi:hypothetical protein